jgi:hypothetical protein
MAGPVKKSSIIHHDSLSVIIEMPDEMAGRFVKNLLCLMRGESIDVDDLSMKMALHPFISQFKRDQEAYEKQCKKNRLNGSKGGRPPKTQGNPKNPSGLNGTQGNPKNPDNDSDKDNDNDNKSFPDDSAEIRLSELLFKCILKRNPNHKKPNFQTWAKNIDLMIRVDKRQPQDIANVIAWSQEDDFWKNNILSTEKLRKQFDTLVLKMAEKKTGGQVVDSDNPNLGKIQLLSRIISGQASDIEVSSYAQVGESFEAMKTRASDEKEELLRG